MARVDLSLELPPTYHDEFVATWDVVNPELEVVASGSFLSRNADTVTLPPGKYWARVGLPNNQSKQRAFLVKQDTDHLNLNFAVKGRSRQDWLGWAAIGEAPAAVQSRDPGPALEGLWVRSWLFEEKTWRESDDADQAKLLQDGGLVQLELAPQSNSLCALQLGGHFESRFLVVPPQGVSRVLITPPLTARADEAPGYDVDVTISMANSVADHLSQFLCAGSPSAWDGLDRKLVQGEGMALLDGKRSDPLGAAVGGYILLQGSSSPPPLSWLRNLTNVAPWLADGPILCAHAALKYRRRDAVDESIEYLLKASERAYPVLRRGIDLFLDTLRLLRSSKISLPDEIEAQADLYAAARGATTRQTAFTGFLGELPWSPLGFDRVQSRPGRQRHAGNASSRSPRRL